MNTEKTGASASAVRIPHTIQLDRRKRAVITGVTDVCSFHETEIVMKLEGSQLYLTGQNLHIGKLLPEEGRLDIDGQVDSLVYEQPRNRAKVQWWPWRKKTL